MSDIGRGEIVFAALEPDAALAALIVRYKEETRALVGEQTYLADPPHLTVYLAAFASSQAAVAAWANVSNRDAAQTVRLVGWHVFEADALTGCHTLVCQVAAADKARLRRLQRDVVDALAPARQRAATAARLAPRLEFLTPQQRQCAQRNGFPYLGDGWEPHFTIASVRPADWPRLWVALEPHPPHGTFRCTRLRLYRLAEGTFEPIDGVAGPA
jgi:2'-5' RNA ligase